MTTADAASKQEGMKRRAAGVSLWFNLGSTVFKLIAAMFTHSVSLYSEAAHSATDVVASFVALLSVRAAAVPPDEEHPYGHGKIESLAGFTESMMLLVIVVVIAVQAIQRLFGNGSVEHLDIGIAIMGLSAFGSLCASLYVRRVAVLTGSMALKSNGQHLGVDFWTSLGVLLALGITKVTGWVHADAVVAILLSGFLAFSSWSLGVQAFHELIDRRLSDQEIATIRRVAGEHEGMLSFHRLRTRLSGNTRYIDMHIVVPNDWTVVQAHDCADLLEKRLQEALSPAVAVIHVDPFDPNKAFHQVRP